MNVDVKETDCLEMELKLEVLLSSSIKCRKPWPRFCWLGREKEAVFLLDDSRISEVHLVSGQTKKKTPKLQPLLQRVVTMSGSQDGMWLVGLLLSGELFLWNKDRDSLKMIAAVPAVHQLASSIKGSVSTSLLVWDSGQRVLLAVVTGQMFLWECLAPQDLSSSQDVTVRGRWSQISPPKNTPLPSSQDKEASIHSVFVKNQEVGDVCLSVVVFSTEGQLNITFLKIHWEMIRESSCVGFTVHWLSKSYLLSQLEPPCRTVKSRGALISALSPDTQLLAIVLNQKDPRVTQVLFISTQNFVTVSSPLGGCGLKTLNVPAKYVRSYWVCSVSWTADSLYLACVLKRGSLLMLPRLGGLVSLSTTGCNIEFGPAHFLPLHPLVTYRTPGLQTQDGALSSSSMSLRDPMRQRYSVTCHPRQPILILSDGYMVTVLRLSRWPSAATIMSALLLDAAQGLENIRRVMGSSQPQVRSKLESMSTLTITGSLLALKETEPPLSTLPVYLQETGETAQGKEDDDSDDGLHSHMKDEGKLEFASMFDTLHAQTHSEVPKPTSSGLQEDMNWVYRNLLRVWALGLSVGGAIEQRERLLNYTIICIVRLVNLLRVRDFISRKNRGCWVTHDLRVLRSLLAFLPWDSTHVGGSSCLPLTVQLIRRFVGMFLPLSSADVALSSQNFSAALLVLKEASQSLNLTYTLQPRALHHEKDGQVSCSSDMFTVQLPCDDTHAETIKQSAQSRKLPSDRLVVVWRDVYRQALQYQTKLNNIRGHRVIQNEHEKMSEMIAQIQQALQTAGDCLQESHMLRDFTGEQHFILGEYTDSVQVWRAELQAERDRDAPLTCYLETRYCLAFLYTLLFQYQLREAQGLCDRLARQLQPHAGQQREEITRLTDDCVFEGWFFGPVGHEAACAVVQSLGRFMAAFFTNHPLCIRPPHCVDVLPPLHLPHDAGGRAVELCRSRVVDALRSQHLSEVWTVDYTLELLLLGGLVPEAAWMAQCLGDWKMAATFSLAYSHYCSKLSDISRWRELHLPPELQPAVIFRSQLELMLGRVVASEGDENTDPACVEDMELLQASVQEILKASVMAEVDVFSQPLTHLLDSAKEQATSLPVLVPAEFYLPAPPLYCPQPSPNTQDAVRLASLILERDSRCGLSGLVQKVLLLFRAAHSSRPAAQWYIRQIHHCRHVLHKICKKEIRPNADLIPEGLKRFSSCHGFFQSGPSKDMDSVTVQTIICFRELCALCWMLHARDQLSISCRRYQTVRSQNTDVQLGDLCVEALRWACRLLPFCHFLNAEETLQDLVLSLLSELTPSHVTAETLARVFPGEAESVRVPLREKYTSLVQRLRTVFVPDTFTPGSDRDVSGETMMILIQDQLRKRRREHQGLEKSLAAVEQFLWEREEQEDRGGADFILKRLSLGTSLSDSTLTDCGRPSVYSEGDTAETLSEAPSPDLHTTSAHRLKTATLQEPPDRSTHEREDKHSEVKSAGPCLPAVGSWEFELEDEEYTLFLNLFLSYVLEKDGPDIEVSELPLLRGFSKQLRAKELHSVTFDMLTTLRRRQRDGHQTGCKRGVHLPVFRAGRCFQTVPLTPEMLGSTAQISTNTTPARTLSGLQYGKPQGLFSLRQQATLTSSEVKVNLIGLEDSASQSPLPLIPQVKSWAFKILSQTELDVQVQLDSVLETRFPELARLLEWIMRWADRRVLLSQPIRVKSEGCSDSVVIRARVSTPAVLSALKLLEQRFTTNKHDIRFNSPAVPLFLQSVTDRRRERDSSVDAVQTPNILTNAHHPPRHDVFEVEDVVDQIDAHLSEEEDLISDPQNNSTVITGEIRQTSLSEHDESSIADVTGASGLLSNQSRSFREAKDQTLTLADLECPNTDDYSEHLQSEGNHISCGALDQDPHSFGDRPEASDVHQTDQSSSHLTPAEVTRPSERRSISADPPHSRAEVQTDPVRQLLRDELFRLVQLQQINFMSLMQVVGASLSQLPQPHTAQSHVNLPQTTVRSAQPQSEATHVQTQTVQHAARDITECPTRTCRSESVSQSENRRLVHSSALVHDVEQRNPALITQQLTIRPDWPQDGPADVRSFIPTTEGLLTTAHDHTHLQTGPGGVSDAHLHFTPGLRAAPLSHGLKLLQLKPLQPVLLKAPAVREAWAPSNVLSSVRRAAETSVAPLSHSDMSRRYTQSSERTRAAAEPLRFPPAAGLPLLRFHPEAQRPVTLPHIPQPTAVKLPSADITDTGSCSRIQLLHRDPDPPTAGLLMNTPLVRTPRLIPLEELLRWAAGKQTCADTKLQLLKTDSVLKNSHTSSPSSKRQKRREEKSKNEKIGVTFRPEESIIPPDKTVQSAEKVSDQNDEYVIPLGTFDCELTGQMLLDKTYSTSAELHAYASTQKRAPEIQDACTNTDPEPSPSITDKVVSVQLPSSPSMPSASNRGLVDVAPKRPPDVFLNLRFSKEKSPVQPKARKVTQSDKDINEGRRFINVIDLADDSLLQNLPPSQTPNSPSSAQLHLMAASVINSAPDSTEHIILPTEELPGLCESPAAVEAVLSGDPVTLNVLSAVNIPSGSLERVLMSRSQITARLSEMDAQLLRLQGIADHMDREFANTRLLVNTVETGNPVKMPSVEREPDSRPQRTLQEVETYNSSVWTYGASAIQKPEDQEIFSSTAYDQRSAEEELSPTAVKQEQHMLDTNQYLTLLEDSRTRADETLGLTGLSDVRDILSELVREGALSRSALGLSQRAASKSSRPEVKLGVMMEEERRDIRMWMRRKQRERLTEYHKQRQENREGEHRPFISPLTHNPTSADLETHKKMKEDRDKMVLQKHYEQRAHDACSLITDLLTTPVNLPTEAQQSFRSKSQSSVKKSPKSPSRPHRCSASSPGKTVVLPRKSTTKPHGSLSKRLGLHRPASALPGDRLSQVTRRGMLRDLNAERETKRTHRSNAFQPFTVKPVEDTDERDHPAEVNVILRLDNKQGFEEYDEDFSDVDGLVGLDALSDSYSSVLSKLDWDAIEKIVAEEDDE